MDYGLPYRTFSKRPESALLLYSLAGSRSHIPRLRSPPLDWFQRRFIWCHLVEMVPAPSNLAEEAYLGSCPEDEPSPPPTHIASTECPTPLFDRAHTGVPCTRFRGSGLPGPELKGLAAGPSPAPVVRRIDLRTIHAPGDNFEIALVLICQGWPDRIRPSSALRPPRPQSASLRSIRHSLHDTAIL